MVNFSFAANTTTVSRSANISLLGLPVAVTQQAPILAAGRQAINSDALPVAQDLTLTIDENSDPVPIMLITTDTGNTALTFQIAWYPTAGTLTGSAPNLIYTPAPNDFGTHHFGYVAIDSNGQTSNTADVTIVITYKTPFASFSTTNPNVVDVPVLFDAGTCSNSDGTVTTFMWDFGDGSTATTATSQIEHTYSRAKRYSVTLTITDSNQASASVVKTVAVSRVSRRRTRTQRQ